ESSPGWAPDGKYISFISSRGNSSADAAGGAQLWLMRADGGEPRLLTRARMGVGDYVWSPTGHRIGFTMMDPPSPAAEEATRLRDDAIVFEASTPRRHIWTVDPASGEMERITSGEAFSVGPGPFSWSPDGRRIAFQGTLTGHIRDSRYDVLVVSMDTRKCQTIAGPTQREQTPVWSPDGRTIAYWRSGAPVGPEIRGIPAW